MNEPLVTVLIAVYNGERYLAEALETALGQTFTGLEVLVVDDGSTDQTGAILAHFAQADPRLRVVRQVNQGQTRALNNGIAVAKGRYIARLDHDDLMAPSRIESQADFLDRHPDVCVLGSAVELLDTQGVCTAIVHFPTSDSAIKDVLIKGNPFMHSSVMFRVGCVRGHGCYNPNYGPSQDYELWMRMSRSCSFATLREPLAKIRCHEESMSARQRRRQAREHLAVQVHALALGWYPLFKAVHTLRPLAHMLRPDWTEPVRQALRRRRKQGTLLVEC